MPVQGRSVVDAAITSSGSLPEEVVVNGYGTAARKDITGAVTSVKGKKPAKIPVTTAAEAMTGIFSWDIIKGLQFRTEEALDYSTTNDDRFYGITTYYIKNTPSALYQNLPPWNQMET